jgi:hypothetical protein
MAEDSVDDVRWQVVKSMIDEFPELKEKIRSYIQTPDA